MNQELIKSGISAVIEGLEVILSGLEEGEPVVNKPVREEKATEEIKEELKGTETEDQKNLEDLSFNELKAMAKSKGLKAGGTKPDLIKRIQEAEDSDIIGTEEAPVKEKSNVVPFKSKKKAVEEVEEEETGERRRSVC